MTSGSPHGKAARFKVVRMERLSLEIFKFSRVTVIKASHQDTLQSSASDTVEID